jgi:hypothetical protein
MIKVRITLKDGRKFFVSEGYPYNSKAIYLNDSFSEGLAYHTPLEFRVAWKIYNNNEHMGVLLKNPNYKSGDGWWLKNFSIKPEDVVKFESIDDLTLKKMVINMNKIEHLPKSKVLKFPPDQFNMLKRHPYTCCHWTYVDEQWVAFSKDEDYPKINNMRYFRRGFTGLIWDAFCYRNCDHISFMNDFYDYRKELLFNPIIHKMYLRDDIDSCETYIVKPLTIPA